MKSIAASINGPTLDPSNHSSWFFELKKERFEEIAPVGF